MNKELDIVIEDEATFLARNVALFSKLDAGDLRAGASRLSFGSLEVLLKTLTPRRLELLKALHTKSDGASVRHLAQHLGRDYKNVHADCRALEVAGLLERGRDNQLLAPWSSISANLSLEVA